MCATTPRFPREREQIMRNRNLTACGALFLGAACAAMLAASPSALAQSAPHSFVASPEIYKVIAENEQLRIVAVSWAPGQRDEQHSHPEAGVYYLTDCYMRGYGPDGKSREGQRKAGTASVNKPVPSHSVENIGHSECRLIMFERK